MTSEFYALPILILMCCSEIRPTTDVLPNIQDNDKEYAVQILRSMYRLKQSGRVWYQHFKAEMLAMDFKNNDITPCLFIKTKDKEFVILAIYVDDINIFGSKKMILNIIKV